MNTWKLAVFDLDGVLTDTAFHHFKAWKETLEAIHIPVDDEVCELVKGISRSDSLDLILKRAGVSMKQKQFQEVLEDKNHLYQEKISHLSTKDILPGIEAFLKLLHKHNIICAVASASKSAPMILNQLGIHHYFDYIVDPTSVAKGKPAPDIFLAPCTFFNINPEHAVGFEDARAGIRSIKSAGLLAVAIGHESLKEEDPNVYYSSTSHLDYEQICQLMEEENI